jgi:hypothetical protein
MAKNAEPGRSYVLTDTILHWMPTIEIVYLKSATTFQMVFMQGDMAGSRRLIFSCESLGTEPVIDKYRPHLLPKSGLLAQGAKVNSSEKAASRYGGQPMYTNICSVQRTTGCAMTAQIKAHSGMTCSLMAFSIHTLSS